MKLPPTQSFPASPRWSSTAKLVVGLSFVALIFGLLVTFRSFIGPMILALVVTYLLQPLALYLNRLLRSWRISVLVLYLVLLVLLSGAFTWAGVVIVQQIQSLVGIVERAILDIPRIANELSTQVYTFGPFQFSPGQNLDLTALADQLLSSIQPLLSQVTSLVGSFATGALVTIGYGSFVLLVSFFLLSDARNATGLLDYVSIPGYDADVRRMGRELGQIWNSFLRGQLFILGLVLVSYTILLWILGVRFAIGIAIIAGLARFVPYVGPAAVWVVTIIAAFFQAGNHFGLDPLHYTILVIILAVVLDQIFDNLIAPQIMGQTLKVQPVVVLIGAIVAANFIGIIGIILAAPVVATLKLFATYAFRKMLDLDPWPEIETRSNEDALTWGKRALRQVRAWWRSRKVK